MKRDMKKRAPTRVYRDRRSGVMAVTPVILTEGFARGQLRRPYFSPAGVMVSMSASVSGLPRSRLGEADSELSSLLRI